MDLRQLYRLLPGQAKQPSIRAPYPQDATLLAAIENLRASGEVVEVSLPGSIDYSEESQCNRELVSRDGVWQVVAI
jgi:ATP phosphoribosyltransferase regulatory subunit